METKNGQNRSSQLSEQPQDSQSKVRVGSVGSFSGSSAEYGFNQITTGRKNSYAPNTLVAGQQRDDAFPGEVIGQLIDENEKQLAYHEHQAQVIRLRIQELKQIPESLTDINHKE
ncbi:MAG: hypothetical protein V7K64_29630 [Nostoc sp.]